MQNINMEEVFGMSFEDDIKDVLDKHEQILDDHEDKIQKLEVDTATTKEKMINLEGIVTRFESNSYQTQNSMMQLLSQVIVNTSNSSVEIVKNATQSEIQFNKNRTEIAKVKNTNNMNIILKTLAVISAIVLGYFSIRYGLPIK